MGIGVLLKTNSTSGARPAFAEERAGKPPSMGMMMQYTETTTSPPSLAFQGQAPPELQNAYKGRAPPFSAKAVHLPCDAFFFFFFTLPPSENTVQKLRGISIGGWVCCGLWLSCPSHSRASLAETDAAVLRDGVTGPCLGECRRGRNLREFGPSEAEKASGGDGRERS